MMLLVSLCPRPSAEVSGESEVFRDPLWGASNEVERDGPVCSRGLLEA
jgi:hypothetical protein